MLMPERHADRGRRRRKGEGLTSRGRGFPTMAYAWRTMAEIDFPAEIRALRATYESIEAVSDVERIRKDIAELSEQAGVPDLWDDPAAAQKITSKLSHRQSELERLEKLAARIDDLRSWRTGPGGRRRRGLHDRGRTAN